MSNNIRIDTSALNQLTKDLKGFEKEIPGAVTAAVNRVVDFAYTQAAREVTNIYALKQSDVKKTMRKYKASAGSMKAKVQSKGSTVSLASFPHTPTAPVTGKSIGGKRPKALVKVRIKKGAPMTPINSSPKAFLQKANGSTVIFKRKGKARTPVEALKTLSVPQMISNEAVSAKITDTTQAQLQKRIMHEVEYRLNKIKSKTGG